MGLPRVDQGVQMTTHTRRAQTQSGSDFGGGDRALLEQQPHHRRPGVALVGNGSGRDGPTAKVGNRIVTCAFSGYPTGDFRFHNTSVTEFRSPVH